MGEHGWPFASADAFPGADTDPEIGAQHVKDLYFRAQPDYDGRFTVPVLWDRQTGAIVNNESSEIIRMFYGAFDGLLPAEKRAVELYPEHLRKEIDGINEWVYDRVNSQFALVVARPGGVC
jgi:putative glutathione S-transferase